MTLNKEKLENLLEKGESNIVDIKQSHYFNTENLGDKDKTAELVKDILCMNNRHVAALLVN